MFNLYKKIYKIIEQGTDNNFRLFAQNKKIIIKKISVSDYFHLIEIIFNNILGLIDILRWFFEEKIHCFDFRK